MKLKNIFLLLIIVVFAACSGNKKDGKELTLNVGVMASMDYLPIAVADAKGYFAEEGITVNIQKFFSANDRDAAIQSGNLDASILDYTGGAIQKAGGVELFFTSQCDATFELVAGKNVKIQSNEDLKGKNFAVARNTVVDFCTDMVLQNAEIEHNEVVKSEINKIPLRLEMLRNEKIDLTVLPDPFATIAKADGNPLVTTIKDLGYQVTGIVFTKQAIDEKKKTIKAFYTAYNKAIVDIQESPLSDFQEILVNEIGFPQPLVGSIKLPDYKAASLPQAKDLEAVGNWLKERELIPTDFDINSIVNTDFIVK